MRLKLDENLPESLLPALGALGHDVDNGWRPSKDDLDRYGREAETAAELDALLPAVLDRAFKGEL